MKYVGTLFDTIDIYGNQVAGLCVKEYKNTILIDGHVVHKETVNPKHIRAKGHLEPKKRFNLRECQKRSIKTSEVKRTRLHLKYIGGLYE